ncbi:MAG: hypothetical protein LBS21_13040 [Clostridiales bacterium]|nr:hypothetical protein [Clostridiales bacterium]
MAKAKRGRGIKKTTGWRGTCPVCSRTGVKLLWSKTVDGAALKTCKQCGQ